MRCKATYEAFGQVYPCVLDNGHTDKHESKDGGHWYNDGVHEIEDSCGHVGPQGFSCQRPESETHSIHQAGNFGWPVVPQRCDATNNGGHLRCRKASGHGGVHINGDTEWPNYEDYTTTLSAGIGPDFEGEKMRCQETLHGIRCTLDADHLDCHRTPGLVRFLDSGADSQNPEAPKPKCHNIRKPEFGYQYHCTKPKGHDGVHSTTQGWGWNWEDGYFPHEVEADPLRDKMLRQKQEIKRLNQSLVRLRDLAHGRLERNNKLQRENNRLAAHLTTALAERDGYKRMLEEANDRLAGDGYFLGLQED